MPCWYTSRQGLPHPPSTRLTEHRASAVGGAAGHLDWRDPTARTISPFTASTPAPRRVAATARGTQLPGYAVLVGRTNTRPRAAPKETDAEAHSRHQQSG